MALDVTAMVVLGWIFALVMCFAMGSNDESMSSAYGSRAFSLNVAIAVGASTQVLGSVLMGEQVTITIQGKLFETTKFTDDVPLLILIFLVATISAALFLIIASFFGWPISTTHGIIGGIAGAAIGAKGFGILKWSEIGVIVASWFISPLSGGVVTAIFFFLFEFAIIRKQDPYGAALVMAPIFYAFGVCGSLAFVLFKGLPLPSSIPQWGTWAILGVAFILILIISYLVIHRVVAKWIERQETIYIRDFTLKSTKYGGEEASQDITFGKLSALYLRLSTHPNRKVEAVFVMLQMLTAPMVAFARGANDVSNGIGPLAAIIALGKHREGAIKLDAQPVDVWVLLVGGAVIAIGLFVLGRNVIKTVGEKITNLTPTRGVSVEVGTAVTVLAFSALGLPISSTHTLVGSIFAIGVCMKVKARYIVKANGEYKGLLELEHKEKEIKNEVGQSENEEFQWKNALKIFASWIITIPAAGVLAGVCVLIINNVQ